MDTATPVPPAGQVLLYSMDVLKALKKCDLWIFVKNIKLRRQKILIISKVFKRVPRNILLENVKLTAIQ